MAQKLFTIHRICFATIDIEVAADTGYEAMKIARQRFENIPGNAYDLTENEVSIIGSSDVPDVDDLVEKVVNMMTDQEMDSVSVSVDVKHTIYEYFGGRVAGETEVLDRTAELYMDDGNLMVSYETHWTEREPEDEPLEELCVTDQIKVLLDALK